MLAVLIPLAPLMVICWMIPELRPVASWWLESVIGFSVWGIGYSIVLQISAILFTVLPQQAGFWSPTLAPLFLLAVFFCLYSVPRLESNGPYALGWKVVTLSRGLTTEVRLVQDLRPYLEKILREVRQTVNLGVLNDVQVAYLDCLIPNHTVSLYTPPGLLVPAYATSLGKALLAHLPAPQLEDALSRLQLEPLTSRTITSKAGLKAALEEVRRKGYAADDGELHRDVHCVAAPIKDPNGCAIAAISVTAREVDLPARWEKQTASVLVACTQEAAQRLFGTMPSAHR